MNRSDVISKHYKQMCNISRVLTDYWEDMCHDLCEYFLTCKADIVEIDSRGKFLQYFYSAASHWAKMYKNDKLRPIHDTTDIIDECTDVDKLIKNLDPLDLKILSIFATGASISEVSRKIKISRITLRKHLTKAQSNAKQIIDKL